MRNCDVHSNQRVLHNDAIHTIRILFSFLLSFFFPFFLYCIYFHFSRFSYFLRGEGKEEEEVYSRKDQYNWTQR